MSQLTCPKCGSEDLEEYELTGHADGSVTCPYCPVEAASVDAASWSPDLSDTEQAVVAVLTGESECTWHHGCDVEDCYGPRARTIVAAVRPILLAEFRADLFAQAAELPGADEPKPDDRSQIEADALDALADVADAWEPPTAAHLRTLAFMVRKGLSTINDLRADALSRPTSEETP